jgi:hypothetical protein
MSLITWQSDVPGVQTVTFTHGLLRYDPLEQREPFTVMGMTLTLLLPAPPVTVMVVEPEMLPAGAVTASVAMISVEPAAEAVALPLLSMVATDRFVDPQVAVAVRSWVVLSE